MHRAPHLLVMLLCALSLAACRGEVSEAPGTERVLPEDRPDASGAPDAPGTSGDSGALEPPRDGESGMAVEPPPVESEAEMTREPPPAGTGDDMLQVPPQGKPEPLRPAPRPGPRQVQR